MKLSTRARYALRMMVEIAQQTQDGTAVSLSDVADRTEMPRRYLEQLAIGLKQAQLIRGITGKGGGYLLLQPPTRIGARQIIEAAIGPINIVDCVGAPEICRKADRCECRWVYLLINSRVVDVLDHISLADLADRSRLENIVDEFYPGGLSAARSLGKDVKPKLSALLEKFAEHKWGTIRVDQICLYRSDTLAEGARYTVISEAKLDGEKALAAEPAETPSG